MTLDELNALPASLAEAWLFDCCASTRWSQAMSDARPFADLADLHSQAAQIWAQADTDERLNAFAAHPLIGDVKLLRARFAANAATANREQGQILEADDATLEDLAELNIAYRERHGFIFIICASGQSPQAMLAALQARLGRTTEEEILTAAQEQQAITALRLTRLLSPADPA